MNRSGCFELVDSLTHIMPEVDRLKTFTDRSGCPELGGFPDNEFPFEVDAVKLGEPLSHLPVEGGVISWVDVLTHTVQSTCFELC